MEDGYTKKLINTYMREDLEKLGLETYPGCRVSLLESVQTEFGDNILQEVFRQLSDDTVIELVHNALLLYGLIDHGREE
jgi:hypothetical protein